MHEMITADRQRVTIAGDHPHTQFGIRGFDARGNGRRPSVYAVKTVRVHVIGKARRAADAGYENHLLARNAEFGHYLLHVV